MKLVFKLKGNEEKWPVRLEGYLGKQLAEEAKVEVDATASEYIASVQLLEYKNNTSLENKIKSDSDVVSAFLVDNKEVKKRIV